MVNQTGGDIPGLLARAQASRAASIIAEQENLSELPEENFEPVIAV